MRLGDVRRRGAWLRAKEVHWWDDKARFGARSS